LSLADFPESIGLSIGLMGVLAVGFRIVSYVGLVLISTPSKPKITRKVRIDKKALSNGSVKNGSIISAGKGQGADSALQKEQKTNEINVT